ncbi:MAG: glycosyltransferase [Methanobacteriaceae archaeon]|jgi:glycosyltransferase involved in cell wall biosynthesis
MKDNSLISIIIPTLNSEKTLEQCLKSIENQSYQNYEVIVVDGGSEDKTVEIAEKFNAKVINANIKNMSKQTNIGISNSNGRYIYRVDSDVILNPKILEKCIEKCEGYDGVCTNWIPDESISFWAKVRKIEKESYVKHLNYVGAIKYNKNVAGATFLRRDVIDSVGGFDENVPTFGEDFALFNKLARSKFHFGVIDVYETHIGEPRSLMDVIRKNFRYGYAAKTFLKNQGTKKGAKQFSPVGRVHLTEAFKNAFKKDKSLFLGLTIYIFALYASASIGFIYSIIRRSQN